MNLGPKYRQVNHLGPFVRIDPAALFERHNPQTGGSVSPLKQVGRYISTLSGGITRTRLPPSLAMKVLVQ